MTGAQTRSAPRVGVNPFECPVQGMRTKPNIDQALRSAGPVVEVDAPGGGPAWVITDSDLGRQVLNDSRFVKDPRLAPSGWHGVDDGLDFPDESLLDFTIISVDGPEHRRLRRIHAGGFSPARLKREQAAIRDIAVELLGRLEADEKESGSPTDLADLFAFSYPLLVMCHLLGVPVHDAGTARAAIASMKAMSLGTAEAVDSPEAYALLGLIQEAISDARDGADTMTGVLLAKSRVEFGGITDEQLTHMIIGLIFAGHDTTGAFLSLLLAEYLNHRSSLALNNEDLGQYVTENLRFHPPVPYTLWRFTTEDVSLSGVLIPRGSGVLVAIQGINSDERVYANPDTLEPSRDPGPLMTFGAGPHYCPGEQLAHLEARTMLQVFDDIYPDLVLDHSFQDVTWTRHGSQTARISALPVFLSRRLEAVR